MKLNTFTYEEYEYILTKLKARYDLVNFEEAYDRSIRCEDLFATIRHDIDVDLSLAFDMAKIESSLGVNSSYFVLISSDAYNIFSDHNRRILKNIISMGHTIGLHYNPLSYELPVNLEDLNYEASVLEKILDSPLKAVSWHKPASLSGEDVLKSSYLDTTQPPFFNAGMKYFADSRGVWRYGHPLESSEFKVGYPLHICFHPIWWNSVPLNPLQRLNNFIRIRNNDFRNSIIKEISPENESYTTK